MRSALTIMLAFLVGAGAVLGWNAWRTHQAFRTTPQPTIRGSHLAPGASTTPRKPLLSAEAPPSLLPDRGWPADAPTPEQVMVAQPDLLDREISQLKPRTPGKVNLYAIVFAGDGSENVFRNEAEYFRRLLAQRFHAAGHVIVLENNPAALTTRPLADWSNLESALDAAAAKMNPKQDILLLYLTSHGSEDHTLLVDMDPLPLDQIGANDLAGILNEHPFKYKVVVVNACYSGGFIPPLHGAGTLVITAARGDRSSFGCGEQSQLTWFGHAFLVDALNRTGDFARAFQLARTEVAQWEKHDGYTPSEPQIAPGAGIQVQLATWENQNPAGAVVPFKPLSAPRAAAEAARSHH
ncbi:MAG TPA: C13 family peptidase [Rhodanobacteraceae bacterium]|nr:C13 family peptidase [Rhodanobacteraceae bacterium]